ncbi:S-adenosyl-L-methionine-dependent methyltransferase, partial [Dacryopinax primogenitus]
KRILDIGVGSGGWAVEVAELFPEAEMIGVDIVESKIENGPPNFTFRFLNVVKDEWPFPLNTFDIVHCRFLLMHTPNFEIVLNKAIDIVAPEGILMAVDPANRFEAEGKPVPTE